MTELNKFLGGKGVKLAPDLTYPSQANVNLSTRAVTVGTAGALTTILNISGKFAISNLIVTTPLELITIKMTIDGVVIFNDTFTATYQYTSLLGVLSGATNTIAISCDTNLKIEVQTVTGNTTLRYDARPIL